MSVVTTAATVGSATAKHAILLLHGYGMSATSIMAKTGALRSEVKAKKLPFEFFALDGPFDCETQASMPKRPPTPPKGTESEATSSSLPPPPAAPATAVASGVNLPANLTLEPGARAWYSFENVDATSRYEKFEEGFQYIVNHCSERAKQGLPPYRGVFAFSQGTIMATMLAVRLQNLKKKQGGLGVAAEEVGGGNGDGDDDANAESKSTAKTQRASGALSTLSLLSHIEFVVLVSGLLPKDTELRREILVAAPLLTPSLHILGKVDKLVDPSRTLELAAVFAGDDDRDRTHECPRTRKMLFEHEGGHVIPSQARKPFKEFLEMLMNDGRF